MPAPVIMVMALYKGCAADEYSRLVKQIFKKYEERLVALEQELPIGPTVVSERKCLSG